MNDDWKKADGTPDDLIYDMDIKPVVGDVLSIASKGNDVLWEVAQVVFAFDSNGLYSGVGVRVEKLKIKE